MTRPKWLDWVPDICPHCGEIRALTVGEVNKDPLFPDFIKELIVPILKEQREMQRKVAGVVELAYLRGKQEGEEKEREKLLALIHTVSRGVVYMGDFKALFKQALKEKDDGR